MKETKEAKEAKEAKEMKEAKETKETKETKDTKEAKEMKEAKDTKERISLLKEKWVLQSKRTKIIILAAVGFVVLSAAAILAAAFGRGKEIQYRETPVSRGELTVGIDKDGTVEVGTTTQTLELDISAYTGSDNFSFSNLNAGAGGPPASPGGSGMSAGGMGQSISISGGSSSAASSDRNLKVEAVYVAVGQEIKKGDRLYKLSEESVNDIRSGLESDVNSARVTYEQQKTESILSDLSADQTLQTDRSYSSQASIEYEQTVAALNRDVEDAEKSLAEANEDLVELMTDLAAYNEKAPEYKKLLDNANYVIDTTDSRPLPYDWTNAENAREDAQSMYDDLMDSIEDTQDSIKKKEKDIADKESALSKARAALRTGTIEAKAAYDKAMLRLANADDIYQVTKGQTALATEIAGDDYEEAEKKLTQFNETIDGQTIIAGYSGVVSEVMVEVGDYIGTGSDLVTVNDYDEVTVTLDVEEAYIDSAKEGSKAAIYVHALPDEEFTAKVTEVGDATYDSSDATTYYEVTVTISGNTALLFEGMNATVTFLTRETEEVTYVSNRSIIRRDGASYVKVKNDQGRIVTRKVVTGFSDGTNVEIKEGLSPGEVVLIESKSGE